MTGGEEIKFTALQCHYNNFTQYTYTRFIMNNEIFYMKRKERKLSKYLMERELCSKQLFMSNRRLLEGNRFNRLCI